MLGNEPENATSNDGRPKTSSDDSLTPCPNLIIKEYCLKHAAVFRELTDLRRRVNLLCKLKLSSADYTSRDGRIPKETTTLEYSATEQITRMSPANAYSAK